MSNGNVVVMVTNGKQLAVVNRPTSLPTHHQLLFHMRLSEKLRVKPVDHLVIFSIYLITQNKC